MGMGGAYATPNLLTVALCCFGAVVVVVAFALSLSRRVRRGLYRGRGLGRLDAGEVVVHLDQHRGPLGAERAEARRGAHRLGVLADEGEALLLELRRVVQVRLAQHVAHRVGADELGQLLLAPQP